MEKSYGSTAAPNPVSSRHLWTDDDDTKDPGAPQAAEDADDDDEIQKAAGAAYTELMKIAEDGALRGDWPSSAIGFAKLFDARSPAIRQQLKAYRMALRSVA